MINIVKMIETCGGCPSQWDGWDDEGAYYYFRYRWGYLRIDKSPTQEKWVSGLAIAYGAEPGESVTIYGEQLGHEMDGILGYSDLKGHLSDLMALPDSNGYPNYDEVEEQSP